MAQYARALVAKTMEDTGMIPVFYHEDIEVAWRVVQACYAGGVRAFEFTNRGDFAHEVFAELVKRASKALPGLIMGAGTILDAGTAALYMQNGANFLVTPFFVEEVARTANRRKVLWASGCASLTEISRAEEFGAEIVKVFPGNILGPGFVRSAKGPMPWSKLMPTGGVEPTEASLKEWFGAGVVCVGIGSQLFPKEYSGQGVYETITEKCALCIETIKMIRKV